MSPDEHLRHQVQNRLAELIGPEAASYVMTHLSPEEWPHLATKSDLEELRAATKSDLEELRAATKSDLEELRAATKSDLEELRAATKADIQELRAATKADIEREIGLLRMENQSFREAVDARFQIADANTRTAMADLGSMLRKEMISQTRTMVVALTTIMVTLSAVFIAAG